MLADIVIGNEIKGTERKDGQAQRYVRVPDQTRIYGVNIKAEPSTQVCRLDRDQLAQG